MSTGHDFGEFREGDGIAGEERARCVLVARQVAGDGGHEAVGRLLSCAHRIGAAARAARVVDQLAQGDRCAARLGIEPVPVAREERDLTRNDAELRTSGAATNGVRGFFVLCARRRGGVARADFLVRASEIQLDLAAGVVVEHKDWMTPADALAHGERHVSDGAGGKAFAAFEGDAGRGGCHVLSLWRDPMGAFAAICQLHPDKNIRFVPGDP